MPPCFSAASATLETASTDNTAAATTRTLRMLPSLDIRPHIGPIVSNDIMVERLRNQQAPMSILVLRTNARRGGREPMKALAGANDERSHACLNPSNFQLVPALQIENF